MSDNGTVIEDGNQRGEECSCLLLIHNLDCPAYPISAHVGEPCGSCDNGTIDEDGVCTLRCEDEIFDDDEDSSHYSRGGFDDDDDGPDFGGLMFADPSGTSAIRAATATNPRNLPCPDCGEPDMLTPLDVACGYCCNRCANRNEGMGGY